MAEHPVESPVPSAKRSAQPERSNSHADSPEPLRLFMTSDVRAATGLSRTHLDFYIREKLVRPVARTESGYLLFDHQEVSLLQRIVDDRRRGIALRDIRERIGR